MTVSQYLRTIQTIAIAFIIGQLIFIALFIYMFYSKSFEAPNPDFSKILLPVATIATLISVWSNNYFFKKEIDNSKKETKLDGKLGVYRSAFIKRYAILEGGSLLCIMFYVQTERFSFILFSVLLIGIQLFNFPKTEKIIYELELNQEEQKLINNQNSIIE